MTVAFETVPFREVPSDGSCPICLETKDDRESKTWSAHRSEDGKSLFHHVHSTCLIDSSQHATSCSLCRKPVTAIPTSLKERGVLFLTNHSEKIVEEISSITRAIILGGFSLLLYSPIRTEIIDPIAQMIPEEAKTPSTILCTSIFLSYMFNVAVQSWRAPRKPLVKSISLFPDISGPFAVAAFCSIWNLYFQNFDIHSPSLYIPVIENLSIITPVALVTRSIYNYSYEKILGGITGSLEKVWERI